jgi:hypothetical protein
MLRDCRLRRERSAAYDDAARTLTSANDVARQTALLDILRMAGGC